MVDVKTGAYKRTQSVSEMACDLPQEAERLGRTLMGLIGSSGLKLNRTIDDHACAESEDVSLGKTTWEELAYGLRELGWEASADDTGISTRLLRVSLSEVDHEFVMQINEHAAR